MLIILDGWGKQLPNEFNAIHRAETSIMDNLKTTAPKRWRLLKSHGSVVGLPTEEDMGNSEVATMLDLVLGAILKQGLFDSALKTGAIFKGSGFKYLKEALPNGTLHLIGLLSDGDVHSRFDQLQLDLKGSAKQGFNKI
ncbi:hypothetical protein M758_UG165200 [Ceratodon purpureus]|nr:hypothetical protein M758_UG165200 [Ceratodon purpureus]